MFPSASTDPNAEIRRIIHRLRAINEDLRALIRPLPAGGYAGAGTNACEQVPQATGHSSGW
jgi:hypothetical protein